MFEKNKCKFIYNENNHIDEKESIQYEYVSDLDFYGEIEGFAIKFLNTIYQDFDIIDVYKDSLNGNILDKIIETYREMVDGTDKLYVLFETMGTVLICDYFQQDYYGRKYPEGLEHLLSKDNFKNSIDIFNNTIGSLKKGKSK